MSRTIASKKQIVPKKMLNIIPDELTGKTYFKMEKGMKFDITGVIYSTYRAKDKDGNEMQRRDGTYVLSTYMYIISGDKYTTSKNDTVFSQMYSLTGYKTEVEGKHVFIFDDNDYVPVIVDTEMVKYGTRDIEDFYFNNA